LLSYKYLVYLNRLPNLPSLCLSGICILYSCSSAHKKKADDIETVQITKVHYENSINVPGILETSRSVSYTCPISGFDIQITYLIKEGLYVKKGDTLIKLECSDLAAKYNDAVKKTELAQSEYEKNQAQQEMEISLLQSQIKTNEASTQIAMLDSTKLVFLSKSERKITELRLEKALIEKEKLRRQLEFQQIINKSALKSLQSKIQQQEQNMKQAGEKLDRLTIVADTTGIVQYEDLRTTGKKIKSGDIVWGNMPILKLVDISKFQVRLLVNETQYQSIQNGQKVEMGIDAIKKTTFTGKILQKKPSGQPLQPNSTVKQFEILASIDTILPLAQPGISVTCKVFLAELKDTVAIPIVSVFDDDSAKIVYVRKENKFEKRKVTTGATSDKYIVINKGLQPKEQISLSIPPDYLVK
jgi:HlyD family secretion protein